MILIVGLGNPGTRYAKTRHNIGFRVVELLAERWGFGDFDARFEGELGKGRARGKHVLLLKPQTYMNLSGASAAACARFHKIPPEHVWAVHDDLDLPLGHMRIRIGGSAGGHNGVKSLIERLGTPEFVRIRVGIGRPSSPTPIEDYVVQPFAPEERDPAQAMVERAADAVETALQDGLTRAMNIFNA